MKKALLSLGSNMGDSRGLLSEAVREISALENTEVTAISRVYETTPWGGVEQNSFLNICVEIITGLSPDDLLSALQQIELNAGRVREVRWGPRTLDIDIILYEGVTCDSDRLTIPHPRFTQRIFVLRPMADIYPDLTALGVPFSLEGGEGEAVDAGELEFV